MSLLSSDLKRVSPEDAWQAWKADQGQKWDRRLAAHLLRRAGFGAGPERLDQAVREGLSATLDKLLAGEPGHGELDAVLDDTGRQLAGDGKIDALRAWWVYRMLHGGHPLRERLTLFWHCHFATSEAKVGSPRMMLEQNLLLRRHALDRLEPFLLAISRDPAMLIWLDSVSNVKGHPNENYARELMELFSLGVGRYTEKDVQEAARAFTGWGTDGEQFTFNAAEHDGGVKTVLGQTGPWDGGDVVRIVLRQPAAASFLAGKLYRELVSDTPPPPGLLEPLAGRFRDSKYDIADLVRTILGSRLFFSGHAYRRRIKSPAELVVGTVLSALPGATQPAELAPELDAMGQALFSPPNVKGWPGGRAWLNTTTMLARNNFAERVALGQCPPAEKPGAAPAPEHARVAYGSPPAPAVAPGTSLPYPAAPAPPAEEPLLPDPPPEVDVAARFSNDKASPAALARQMLEHFFPGDVPPEALKRVRTHLAQGAPGAPERKQRIREAVHAILCMAEYQLA